MINKFEDLIAWQASRKLMKLVKELTLNDMFRKDYSLVDQITRSVRSIMSNIAEGYGRYTFNDYKHFITVARGSLTETQTIFILRSTYNILQKMNLPMLII